MARCYCGDGGASAPTCLGPAHQTRRAASIARRVELPLTRKVLADANKEFDQLAASRDDTEMFPIRFLSSITMARRVGSVLAEETRGHRTPAFDAWWKTSGEDVLHTFIVDTRNAELKRGETRIRIELRRKTRPGRRRTRYSIRVAKTGIALLRRRRQVVMVTPAWVFHGGAYDGHEVEPLLAQYLLWLREAVVPTAEGLAT
jgi:hypothetical protein